MVVARFMQWITMVIVSPVVRRVKEQNNVRELGAILEVEDGLKDYIEPSPLESDLDELFNDMRKSKNGFLVQKLWLVND